MLKSEQNKWYAIHSKKSEIHSKGVKFHSKKSENQSLFTFTQKTSCPHFNRLARVNILLFHSWKSDFHS